MTEIYGHKWPSSFGETDANGTWAIGLSGCTWEQIERGLSACMLSGDRWPPELPVFRAMCLGIPSLEQAPAALYTQPPVPFVRQMWMALDRWQLDRADYATARRLVADAYHAAVRHMQDGGTLPAAESPQLTGPAVQQQRPGLNLPRTPASAGIVQREFARMRRILGGTTA